MACNAAFGDVEIAKQFLRDMNVAGLKYEVALVRTPGAWGLGSRV
jgi:hypothetical protein